MAQKTGIINGSDLKIMVAAEGETELVIDNITDCSISITNEMRDSTVKANAGYRALLPGMTSATMSFSSLYATDSDAGTGYEALSNFQLNKTKCDFRFTHVIGQASTENAGDFRGAFTTGFTTSGREQNLAKNKHVSRRFPTK